jgi:4-aminobutyrate aminotransferase-like enzyme
LAVLEVMDRENLGRHAAEVGDYLLAGFRRMQSECSWIGDVRGSGFFLGIELVLDHSTREPATAIAGQIVERMRQLGVLIGSDGPFHNVLKIRPPMVFQRRDADVLLAALEVAFRSLPSL